VSERIREGDTVHVTDPTGVEHEAIADSPIEGGQILVRFTTRGRAQLVPAKHVRKANDTW
jgi:hypothetical protein